MKLKLFCGEYSLNNNGLTKIYFVSDPSYRDQQKVGSDEIYLEFTVTHSRKYSASQLVTVIVNLLVFTLFTIGFINSINSVDKIDDTIFLALLILPVLSIMGVLNPGISVLWWITFIVNSIFVLAFVVSIIFFIVDRVTNPPPVKLDIAGMILITTFFFMIPASLNIYTLLVNRKAIGHTETGSIEQ